MAYSRTTYKRTVHCSYCHQRGHNRSSCPQHAQRIEELRATDSENYYVKIYDAKKARRKAKSSDRTCSYCSTKGHNRSTCVELKAHMAETVEQNKAFRAIVWKRFQVLGIGPGALFTSDRHKQIIDPMNMSPKDSDFYRVPMVIRSINWEALNFWNTEYSYFDDTDTARRPPLFATQMSALGAARWMDLTGYPFDKEILTITMGERTFKEWEDGTHWRAENKSYYFIEIISPVPAGEPPKGWLDCTDKAVKALYKKRKSYMGPLTSSYFAGY